MICLKKMAVISMTFTYICFQMTLTYKIGVVPCHPVEEWNQLQQLLDDLSLREMMKQCLGELIEENNTKDFINCFILRYTFFSFNRIKYCIRLDNKAHLEELNP